MVTKTKQEVGCHEADEPFMRYLSAVLVRRVSHQQAVAAMLFAQKTAHIP